MPLNPLLEQMLAELARSEAPPLSGMTPTEAREMYRAMQSVQNIIELPHVADLTLPGPDGEIPCRVFHPETGSDKPLPCVLYFHGGGWVIGDLNTHDHVCRSLAKTSGCILLSVDYRLAPESTFPASFDDCYAAMDWISANGSELGMDPSRLAVAGDSAGGNLAASVALAARDNKGPAIGAQALVYPVTDTSLAYPSYRENGEGYLLTRESMEYFINTYVPDATQRADQRVAPIRAADLGGLPPALIITAEFDPLRDEGEAYAARLRAAGVETEVTRYDGMIHGFFNMAEMIPDGQTAIDQTCRFLRQHLYGRVE